MRSSVCRRKSRRVAELLFLADTLICDLESCGAEVLVTAMFDVAAFAANAGFASDFLLAKGSGDFAGLPAFESFMPEEITELAEGALA